MLYFRFPHLKTFVLTHPLMFATCKIPIYLRGVMKLPQLMSVKHFEIPEGKTLLKHNVLNIKKYTVLMCVLLLESE